jgi:hypothetical protein
MVSGLKGTTYEEKLLELGLTTMEERRHQADMTQTFKIIHGIDNVSLDTWFRRVDSTVRTTRSCADPLNLKLQTSGWRQDEPSSQPEWWRHGTLFQVRSRT